MNVTSGKQSLTRPSRPHRVFFKWQIIMLNVFVITIVCVCVFFFFFFFFLISSDLGQFMTQLTQKT